MAGSVTGCLICGKPLAYFQSRRVMQCARCNGIRLGNVSCEDGHFVCDGCHSALSRKTVKEFCMASESKDPTEIFVVLTKRPGVCMHGPEHHVMVGASLLTAYRNCGGRIDLSAALDEMKNRGESVPGGICGLWGTCGAAVGCGIAYSIITGSSPLATESWGLSNLLVSECLRRIGETGGPRCCKRDGLIALNAAVPFFNGHFGTDIAQNNGYRCEFFGNNTECIGKRCPFFPI